MAKRKTRSALDELALLQESAVPELQASLARIVRFRGSTEKRASAERGLAAHLARVMAAADLLGRRRILLEVRAVAGPARFADFPFDSAVSVPDVPFLEAIEAILEREPTLVEGWEEAQEAYARGAFAIAQAASLRTVENVGATVGAAISAGIPAAEAERDVRAAAAAGEGFTSAYAQTVLRTNITSAYAAGRHQQLRDPAVRAVASALRYVATLDQAVRDNHKAAHNFVAHADDPVWETLTPPLGFQCRCALEIVPNREAQREGALNADGSANFKAAPAGAEPDAQFTSRGRPDRQFYR